jgi:hypothetical protein
MPEQQGRNLSDLRPRKRKSRRRLPELAMEAISLDWRVTRPIWHILIGAIVHRYNSQAVTCHHTVEPLFFFFFFSANTFPNNDTRATP